MDASTAGVPQPPDSYSRPHFTGRVIIGLLIVVAGVLTLLEALDIPGIHDVWHYARRLWPLVFVAIGASKLFGACSNHERVGGAIWIGFGALFIANNYHWIDIDVWRLFWPVLLILFGITFMRRGIVRVGYHRVGRRRRRYGYDPMPPDASAPADAVGAGPAGDPSAHTSSFAFMSGVTRRMSSAAFVGGDATAVMGGCEIDLRQCVLGANPAVFDAFAFMGGIDLYVPADWTVRNEVVAILGGAEDARTQTAGNPSKVLVLRGAAIMGGIEIKN